MKHQPQRELHHVPGVVSIQPFVLLIYHLDYHGNAIIKTECLRQTGSRTNPNLPKNRHISDIHGFLP
jgi:hypothetical protein